MPNTKQAKRRLLQDAKRNELNKSVSSAMRTAAKKVTNASSQEEAQKALPEAIKRVDKAAKRNIIHKHAAAHRKSQLARAANAK